MRGGGEEEEEEWAEAAMADDVVVAELLVRIKQSSAAVKRSAAAELAWPPLLEWGARQPRSRCSSGGGGGVVGHQPKESTRASPNTPLSWSAGTSGSGDGGAAGDWCEESRPSERSDKVAAVSELNIKRSRKKSYAELKEHEGLLLKERTHLKTVMASLKENYNEERNKNESLKRFKEMKVESESKTVTTSNVAKERSSEQACFTEACHIDHTAISAPREKRKKLATTLCLPSLPSCSREPEKNATGPQKSGLLLPDLNLPLEVDSDSDTLYGMS